MTGLDKEFTTKRMSNSKIRPVIASCDRQHQRKLWDSHSAVCYGNIIIV